MTEHPAEDTGHPLIQYEGGASEALPDRLQRVLPLLACPRCRGALQLVSAQLLCGGCGAQHPIKNCVPILLPAGVADPGAVLSSSSDRVSRHPYSERAEEIIQAHSEGWVLDLGAGGKIDRRWNVVQIDIFRYPSVDLVGSADALPFADDTFDAVISQAVFEHLQYPEWAVAEIRRVLKPGGIAKIDTAFLQPEHGFPHHFFNATETGLRHWFRDFDIEWSGVEPFQQPKWALHWFLGVYLDFIGEQEAAVLRGLSVGELSSLLQRHSEGDVRAEDAPYSRALDALPAHFQRVLAAGVSVHAINPAKHAIQAQGAAKPGMASLDREREMAHLRAEKIHVSGANVTLRQMLKVSQDKASYLTQFYPDLRGIAEPVGHWVALQPKLPVEPLAQLTGDPDESLIFASLVVVPTSADAFFDSFFSLVNQTYGGWELVVLVQPTCARSLRQAVEAAIRLDRRVKIIERPSSATQTLSLVLSNLIGEYVLELPDGAKLAPHALDEIISAARFSSGVGRITFDFSLSSPEDPLGMRCFGHLPETRPSSLIGDGCFSPAFVLVAENFERTDPDSDAINNKRRGSAAHISECLVWLKERQPTAVRPLEASLSFMINQLDAVARAHREIADRATQDAYEQRVLSKDVANYLSQFYPESKNPKQMGLTQWTRRQIARFLRKHLPLAAWNLIFKLVLRRDRAGAKAKSDAEFKPFVTFILEPVAASALINTFFALTHQTYDRWELLLIETHEQSPAVHRALHDFSNLDKRVVVINGSDAVSGRLQHAASKARGDYFLRLIDGVTPAFDAIERVVTLVQTRPETPTVVCDFDCTPHGHLRPLRCFNTGATDNAKDLGAQAVDAVQVGFDPSFVAVGKGLPGTPPQTQAPAVDLGATAYIALCLFHLNLDC